MKENKFLNKFRPIRIIYNSCVDVKSLKNHAGKLIIWVPDFLYIFSLANGHNKVNLKMLDTEELFKIF